MLSRVLGVDLGTTNSVVAYADESRVRVLRDEAGRLLTPSIVAFPPTGDVVVGHEARDLRLRDPYSTIYSVKRLIGRPFDNPLVGEAAKQLPFALEKGPTGGVVVRVRGETLSLPEISAFILRRLRESAERTLKASCSHAVITVPANFNELQRTATRDAAHIAGIEVLRILNEPTAAALAYGYRARQSQRIAVYDFGGGTFDVSILELSGDVIEVVSTAGDTSLGGDDLDRAIADHMAARYAEQHGVAPAAREQTYARLLLAAERLKCRLTRHTAVEGTIRRVAGEDGQLRDLALRLEQRELEVLADPLIDRTFAICEEALRLAGVRPTQLDAVLLVGGQTRTPRVRDQVGRFFGMQPRCAIDPDLAVAQGAALQGYALSGAAASPAIDQARVDEDDDAAFDDEPTRVDLAEGTGSFDDEPTAVSRRIPETIDSRIPSLRAERGITGLTQTLAGVGSEAAAGEAGAVSLEHTEHASFPSEERGDGDPRFKTLPSRPGALRPASRRSRVPPALRARERAPEPDVPDTGAADADRDESDLPPALRSSPPVRRSNPAAATLLESPRAKAKGKGQPPDAREPALPPGVAEARALAAQGDIEAALARYGELLVRDPNDPRLLQEARALRSRRSASAPTAAPASASTAPAAGAAQVTDTLSSPAPADGSAASATAPGQRQLPDAGEREPLEEAISVLSPLPPAQRSLAPDAVSQLPGPRSRAPLLLDVTPHSLNVETVDGFCEPLIERNAPIPTEQTRIFTTSRDRQSLVSVRVSQGESRRTEDNYVLGQIELVELRKAPRGEVQIAVTFMIDADGTLSARAVDQGTGRSQELRVRLTGALDPAELSRMRATRAQPLSPGPV